MTPQPSIDGIAALGRDALETLREVARVAAIHLAQGHPDPRLHQLARIVAAWGPTCPRCSCSITGTSPTTCPGCGARVAWSIETRLI